jgi:hypothetical protein
MFRPAAIMPEEREHERLERVAGTRRREAREFFAERERQDHAGVEVDDARRAC